MDIKTAIPAIPGNEGAGFNASIVPTLGPCLMFYGTFKFPLMAGTIAIANGVVTGSTTQFQTQLKRGDWIRVDDQIYQIKSITSNTSMTLKDLTVTVSGPKPFRLIDAIDLGKCQQATLREGLSKTDLTEAQTGTTAANRVITGYNCNVEISLTRPSIQRQEKFRQGVKTVRNINGEYVGMAFTFPIGDDDLTNAQELRLIRMVGGKASTDPLDTYRMLKSISMTEAEQLYDAQGQRIMTATFNGYIDENVTIDGVPVLSIIGNVASAVDYDT